MLGYVYGGEKKSPKPSHSQDNGDAITSAD